MTMTLADLFGERDAQLLMEAGEFEPCASYYPAMDMLLYLERDCAYRATPMPGSNVELLLAPDTDDVVGVKIPCLSRLVPSHILQAFLLDIKWMVVRVNDNGVVRMLTDGLTERWADRKIASFTSPHKGWYEKLSYTTPVERVALIKARGILE
jgi:hypothetical protein